MKLFILYLLANLITINIQAQLSELSLSTGELREILGKKFDDEIFLKERLRLENAQKKAGEIISHKVGNGFQIPGQNPKIYPYINCKVQGSHHLQLKILKSIDGKLVAILTQDPTKKNLAEFVNVQAVERSVGLKRYNFFTGTNPLRGEMFQLEMRSQGSDFLRIVVDERLFHFKVKCQKQEGRKPHIY